jgi:hypothetical protein
LLIFALQTWFDLQKILRGGNESENFVTINKPVSLVNTIFGKAVFPPTDIKDIENQSFVESVGIFTANQFKVSASNARLGFYTELFFESLPPQYLDLRDPDFRWQEGQLDLPVILSKDYLALYNFGFAASQGLPQFTAATIRQLSLDITIRSRNGQQQTFSGRIVGFSERINSILVPETFMAWANARFGDPTEGGTSRLLLKVANSYDKNLRTYLDEKGYELSTGRLIGSRLVTVLNALIAALAVIGILLMVLSVIVFLISFQLIIAQSAEDIRLLKQIGYRPSEIAKILRGGLLRILAVVFAAVIAVLIPARLFLVNWLEQQSFDLSPMYDVTVILIGVGLMLGIVLLNNRNIQKEVL